MKQLRISHFDILLIHRFNCFIYRCHHPVLNLKMLLDCVSHVEEKASCISSSVSRCSLSQIAFLGKTKVTIVV